MVYMDGDQDLTPTDLDLEPWVTHDIDKEMAAVGSDADVQVVALADRGRLPQRGRRLVDRGPHLPRHEGHDGHRRERRGRLGTTDMGSPQTLVEFIDWARAAYPAQHYALFLWYHGWGWWPGNTMEDATSNDYLDMDELRGALETVARRRHGRLGHLSQPDDRGPSPVARLSPLAMAGSQDAIGYSGFSYQRILSGSAGGSDDERGRRWP